MGEDKRVVGGMDLGRAAAIAAREDDGLVVHLRDETGELAYTDGNPCTVRIAGSYSALYRRTTASQQRDMLRQRHLKLTPELLEKNRIELAAHCILPGDWQGWTDNGAPIGYSPENARKLASVPWILAQLEEAQADHASFSQPPSAT